MQTPSNIVPEEIALWEEFAFYESGLSAHGCIEKLGEFELHAIKKYGRYLLKQQLNYIKSLNNNE
jgi:hypothetical protein